MIYWHLSKNVRQRSIRINIHGTGNIHQVLVECERLLLYHSRWTLNANRSNLIQDPLLDPDLQVSHLEALMVPVRARILDVIDEVLLQHARLPVLIVMPLYLYMLLQTLKEYIIFISLVQHVLLYGDQLF